MEISPVNALISKTTRLLGTALMCITCAWTLTACGEDPEPPKPECTSGDQCDSGVCENQKCQAATCMDGVQNGSETDIDCGGTCSKCQDDAKCKINSDCENNLCRQGVCQGKKAGGESCVSPDDCASGICRAPATGQGTICTTACVDTCDAIAGFKCYRGFCVPPMTCDDPDNDGVGQGPGCADSICQTCSADAECQATSEDAYECVCKSGFQGDGITCTDADECAAGLDNCTNNSTCMNTDGGFTCLCNEGYKDDGNGGCVDVDECADNTDNCDDKGLCINTQGSFTCACPPELFDKNGDGTECTGSNECTNGTNNCDPNATCTDTPEGFTCACGPGFFDNSPNQDGTSCDDIDECSGGSDNCDNAAACNNTFGSFTCTCPNGTNDVNGDGTLCTQGQGACATAPCAAAATCVNTAQAPGYICLCPNGYTSNDGGVTCVDIDECADAAANSCHANATCTNGVGDFSCRCNPGYEDPSQNGNGFQCNNINECLTNTDNCDVNATCTDTDGSFTCECNAPYIGDGVTCRAPKSCKELLDTYPNMSSGLYTINTGQGGDHVVYCDMSTDGGGYTMLKVNHGSPLSGAGAEGYCEARGMHLFIPRNRPHLQVALQVATNSNIGPDASSRYLRLLGIYPKNKGARCVNVPFNSQRCTSWAAKDGGPYYVSDRTDITEPNGDNDTTASMFYNFDSSANIIWYNDIPSPGYTSERFMCDVQDKKQ